MNIGIVFLIEFIAAAVLTCATAAYFDKQFEAREKASAETLSA